MARKTIYQRIQLEGGEQMRKELAALGKDGEKAFRDLERAASPQGFGNQLIAGLQKIQTELKKVGDAFKRAGKSITDAGKTITTRVTAPILGFGGLALKVAGDFEAAMNQVRAVSGATGDELVKMRELAKELGATTQFSASEAAEAMNFLAMAGMKVNDIIAAMPKTLQLASAAQLDMASAADIVTNILSGYNKPVSELSHVTDVLVKAFTSANTDLRQLAEAMKYAGPTAATAGVQFEEAAAALGLMGNAGIQASMAGTSLRGAISRMLSANVQKKAKELGITFTDIHGRLLPLNKILEQLAPHVEDAGLFMELFGQRAGPAFSVLVTQGADALRKLTDELVNSGGTAESIAKVQMEGFNGAIKELQSAFEGLQIAIADSGLLQWATDFVKAMAKWVQEMSSARPETLRMMTIIAGLAATVGPLVIGLGLLVQSIGWIIKSFAAFVGAGKIALAVIAGLAGWPAIIAAALGAAIGLIIAFWDDVVVYAERAWDVVSRLFSDFPIETFTALGAAAVGIIASLASGAKLALAPLMALVGWPALVAAAIGIAAGLIYEFWDEIVAYAAQAWGSFKDLFPDIAGVLGTIWSGIAAAADAAWDRIKATASATWDFIRWLFTASPGALWQGILSAADAVWEGLKVGASGAWDAIKAGFNAIPGAIGWIWDRLAGAAATTWEFLAEQFAGAFDGIVAAASRAWEGLSGIWGNIKAGATEALDVIRGQADALWSGVASSFDEVADQVGAMLADLASRVRDKWAELVADSSSLAAEVVTPWRQAEHQIVGIWQRIVRAIDAQLRSLERSMSSMINRLIAQINRLLDAAARARSAAGGGGGGNGPAFASGGHVRGPGTGTSDSIPAWLSNGEFVIRAAAVRKYGAELFAALNSMRLPKNFPGFNVGGLVSGIQRSLAGIGSPMPRFATGGLVISGGAAQAPGKAFDLHIGGEVFRGLIAPDDVAFAMQNFAGSRSRASAGRKPGWFR